MSKKDKEFSYNNTHGHGIYHIPVNERYPHTDYHKQDVFWIYEELGLLKSWLISLTKLHGMLAQLETNDIDDLVTEIDNLINKLQTIINSITSALENYYTSKINYDNKLVEVLEFIPALINYLNTVINTLMPMFVDLFNCIENRLKIDDNNIYNIQVDIENIYNDLESLFNQTQSSTTLGSGDYSITWYNGFVGSPQVTRRRSTLKLNELTLYQDTIRVLNIPTYRLYNTNVLNANSNESNFPTFSHADSVEDVPTSRIYQLTLTDSNYKSLSSYEQDGNNALWDFRSDYENIRAVWDVQTNAVKVSDNNFLAYMVNINDGYNGQYYYNYPTNVDAYFNNINNRIDYKFEYTVK